jgi:hypothetical protein
MAAGLALAALQLVLFVPILLEGSVLDLPPLYRVDSLTVTFGVLWSLSAAFAAGALLRTGWAHGRRAAGAISLMLLGLLQAAYSRDMLQLLVGWEVAGLALWTALRPGGGGWLAIALHSPGLVTLSIWLLAPAPPFVPPAGGVAQAWPLPVAAALGIVALARSGCWPFNAWPREAAASGEGGTPLVALYCMAAPYLLAKALVAAPWDPQGVWVLVLLGTLGLVGAATSAISLRGPARSSAIASTHAAAAMIGLGLAPGSPLTAAGAVVLLLVGNLWNAECGMRNAEWTEENGRLGKARISHVVSLVAGFAGLWAIAQGALSRGYGLVAVILLPAWGLLLVSPLHRPSMSGADALRVPSGPRTIVHRPSAPHSAFRIPHSALVVSLLLAAVFPQGLIEWLVRPAVGAMAGGVAALGSLRSEWGVGLVVRSAADTVLAALPASGAALAVALALVPIYWLSLLFGRFKQPTDDNVGGQPSSIVHRPSSSTGVSGEAPPAMDALLPGAEQAGRWLDPANLAGRFLGPSHRKS